MENITIIKSKNIMPQLSPVIRNRLYSYLLAAGLTAGGAVGGAILVAPSEGLVLGTYQDVGGVITSCYGHTGPELKMGMTFTRDQCDQQLADDLKKHNKELMKLVKVPLNTYQEAALTSFTYNVGIGNVKSSTLLKLLNNKQYKQACEQLVNWSYAKGKWYQGLFNRRNNEMQVCLGKVDIAVELAK